MFLVQFNKTCRYQMAINIGNLFYKGINIL